MAITCSRPTRNDTGIQIEQVKNAANSMDLGLNRLTPRQFRDIFGDHAKWSQLGLQYNRGGRLLMPLFSILRRIPLLERFFTVSIYAAVQKGA